MKRLLKRASITLEQYNEIIRNLMSNDRNGTWDEIYKEMVEEYGTESALEKSIDVLKESINVVLEEIDPIGDKELYEFYVDQLNKVNMI